MTVPSETNRSGPYTLNGSTTVFDYDFRIVDETHLLVIKADANGLETTLTLNADYTVSGVGDLAGGSITTTSALNNGTLVLLPDPPFTQEIDLENQGAYFAETIEEALDLSVIRDQKLQEQMDRALLIPATADPSELDGLIDSVIRLTESANNIDRVAASADNVDLVGVSIANVNMVAGSVDNVGTVADAIANVNSVGDNIASVNAVAINETNINTVAGVSADVTSVADALPQLEEKVSRRTTAVTVTVGTGGDFATINSAIEALTASLPGYVKGGIAVDISLLSGFTMAEQVLVVGVDLSWIRITSVDAEVTITRSALTERIDTQERYPAFGVTDGGCLPIIAALFNMDTSGTATGRDGVYASVGSRAIIEENASAPNGVKNAGGDGVSAQRNSRIVAHQTNFSGAGENGAHAGRTSSIDASLADFSGAGVAGVYCWRNSDVNCYSATDCSGAGSYGVYAHQSGRVQGDFDCTDAGIHGIYALNGSTVMGGSSDCSGAGTDGVRAQSASVVSVPSIIAKGCGNAGLYALYGSTISAQNADCTENLTYGIRALAATIDFIGGNAQKGAEPSTSDIAVAQGGIIRAATATGGVNTTVNTLGASGVIFQ